jgi:hypothetical protein
MTASTLLGVATAVLCAGLCGASRAFALPFKTNEVICSGLNVIPAPIRGCGDSSEICNQDARCEPAAFSPHCIERTTFRTIGMARVCQVDDFTLDRMWVRAFDVPGICEAGNHIVCGVSYDLGNSIAIESVVPASDELTTVPFRSPFMNGQQPVMVFCACAADS